jgi:hypothetical protein
MVNNILCTTKHTAAENLLLSGDAMNNFMNENWRIFFAETKKEVSLLVGQIVFSVLKESAKTVPFKQMFNDVE